MNLPNYGQPFRSKHPIRAVHSFEMNLDRLDPASHRPAHKARSLLELTGLPRNGRRRGEIPDPPRDFPGRAARNTGINRIYWRGRRRPIPELATEDQHANRTTCAVRHCPLPRWTLRRTQTQLRLRERKLLCETTFATATGHERAVIHEHEVRSRPYPLRPANGSDPVGTRLAHW